MSLRLRRYCEWPTFSTTTGCGWWRRSGSNCLLPTQGSNPSPKLEPGTEFFAAETGRQNGPIHPDCGSRDRANQRIWQTCLCDCGGIASGPHSLQLQSVGGGRDRDRTCDPLDVNEVLSR